jgi:hypothetical protein
LLVVCVNNLKEICALSKSGGAHTLAPSALISAILAANKQTAAWKETIEKQSAEYRKLSVAARTRKAYAVAESIAVRTDDSTAASEDAAAGAAAAESVHGAALSAASVPKNSVASSKSELPASKVRRRSEGASDADESAGVSDEQNASDADADNARDEADAMQTEPVTDDRRNSRHR